MKGQFNSIPGDLLHDADRDNLVRDREMARRRPPLSRLLLLQDLRALPQQPHRHVHFNWQVRTLKMKGYAVLSQAQGLAKHVVPFRERKEQPFGQPLCWWWYQFFFWFFFPGTVTDFQNRTEMKQKATYQSLKSLEAIVQQLNIRLGVNFLENVILCIGRKNMIKNEMETISFPSKMQFANCFLIKLQRLEMTGKN